MTIEPSAFIRRLINTSIYSIKHHHPEEQWYYKVETTRARWEVYIASVYPNDYWQLMNYYDRGVVEVLGMIDLEAKLKDCMIDALYTIRATPKQLRNQNVTADRRYWTMMLEKNFPGYLHLLDWYNHKVETIVYGKS